jgi:PAS domain
MLQLAVARDVANDADDFGPWTDYRVPDDRGAWHPLVDRLYEYWLAVKPPGRLPGRQHIVPEEIAPLWSRLWLLDVVHRPLRYRYRFCGSELVRALGGEVTGRWLDEVHPQLIADPEPRERFRFMATAGCPTWRRGPPHWVRNPDPRTVESCVVPLAGDGVTVDKMIGITVAFDLTGHEI